MAARRRPYEAKMAGANDQQYNNRDLYTIAL